MPKLFPPETVKEALRRLRAGESTKEIAAATGMGKSAVIGLRMKSAASLAASSSPPAGSVPASPISGPDELAGAGDAGDGGGLDAARRMAGSSPPPPALGPIPPVPPPPGSGAGPTPAAPEPEDEIKAVIAFAQTLTVLSCRGFVAVRRVKIDGRILARLSVLSPEEVAQLKLFAPAAAPYIRELLAHQKQVAAAVFAISWVLMVAGKFGSIKEQGIVLPPVKRADPAAPPPAPTVPGAL
jgi:hypothetical protein